MISMMGPVEGLEGFGEYMTNNSDASCSIKLKTLSFSDLNI